MKRGDIWRVHLDPTVGHEQAGRRPALILSVERFNTSGAELVVVLPITSKARRLPTRVRIVPPEGGLALESWVICEQPRTISQRRLVSKLGTVTQTTIDAVSKIVGLLLGLAP
jgi:mRNA interferase MazF